jgi:hypothetical protein
MAQPELHRDILERHRDILELHRDILERHRDILELHRDILELHRDILELHRDILVPHRDFLEHPELRRGILARRCPEVHTLFLAPRCLAFPAPRSMEQCNTAAVCDFEKTTAVFQKRSK